MILDQFGSIRLEPPPLPPVVKEHFRKPLTALITRTIVHQLQVPNQQEPGMFLRSETCPLYSNFGNFRDKNAKNKRGSIEMSGLFFFFLKKSKMLSFNVQKKNR